MARKLSADIPELAVPKDLISALELDRDAGVDFACDMVSAVRESGVFDGVHLIPVSRYREIAARLEGRSTPPAAPAGVGIVTPGSLRE